MSESKLNFSSLLALILTLINLILSIAGVSIGCVLIVFYKLHLISFLAIDFLLLPIVLIGGGVYSALICTLGLASILRKSSLLLTIYALCSLLTLLTTHISLLLSIRILFHVHVGVDVARADSSIELYAIDPYETHRWDALQSSYRCCGVEATFDLGYMSWKTHPVLSVKEAVPDSCCLYNKQNCGHGLFERHSLRRMREYVRLIHIHGCVHAMDHVLKHQVFWLALGVALGSVFLSLLVLIEVMLALSIGSALSKRLKNPILTSNIINTNEAETKEDNKMCTKVAKSSSVTGFKSANFTRI